MSTLPESATAPAGDTDLDALRALWDTVPQGNWERTSDSDQHWKRAINVGEMHAAIWSGCGQSAAHALIAYITAFNPAVVRNLLDTIAGLRVELSKP